MANYLDTSGLTYFYNKLKAKFATKAEVGSPLTASTAAGMTDTSKVYVYTGSETGYTAGDWYYYDGTSWTDGGTYNSTALETDKTLSVGDMAADAEVVGDELTDLKSAFDSVTGTAIINVTIGKYVNLGSTSVTLENNSPKIENAASFGCAVVETSAGNLFTVSGKGDSNARLWAFVKADGTIISKADSGATETNQEHIAPDNTKWFVVNVNKNNSFAIYNGQTEQWKKTAENVNVIRSLYADITGSYRINFTPKKYINVGSTSITLENDVPKMETASSVRCSYVECSSGDIFTISGTGGSTNARLWAFVNSSGSIIDKAVNPLTLTGAEIVAPSGTKWLIINTLNSDNAFCYFGTINHSKKIHDAESFIEGTIPKNFLNDSIAIDYINEHGAYYIESDGDLVSSGSYRTYKVNPEEFDISKFKVGLPSTSNLTIAFYNSETTFDNTTFMDGKKMEEAENIITPFGCKMILISSYITNQTELIIKVYQKNIIQFLSTILDEKILRKYEYTGERISVAPTYNYIARFSTSAPGTGGLQDGTCYGDKFFRFDEYGTILVYDMKTGERIGTGGLAQGETVLPYFNSCSFGTYKYNESDNYPVIYAVGRGRYTDETPTPDYTTYVYRITESSNVYTATLVQTITMDDSTIYPTYGAIAYDNERDKIVGYNYTAVPDRSTVFFEFDAPALTNATVTIDSEDIDRFTLSDPYLGAPQGCMYNNGKLYALGGNINSGTLDVIDFASEKYCSHIDMWKSGLTGEPQCIFVYNNSLFYGGMGNCYEMIF